MAKPIPPTDKQLEYLSILGWTGPPPTTMRDASALIDQLKAHRDAQRQRQRSGMSGCGAAVGCLFLCAAVFAAAVWALALMQPAVAPQSERQPDPPAVTATAPAVKERPRRVWKSAAGGFSVDAEFVSSGGGKVKLRKPDGSEISVSID